MRTSSVDVDALIRWADEAAARVQWASWAPDPGDQVIVSAIRPPLTFSMVLQYVNLRAWLDGRAVTQPQVDAVTNELAAAWWNARMTGIYSGVADVLRDLVLWNAIVRMPVHDREVVRTDLVRRREPPSAPPPLRTDLAAGTSPAPARPPHAQEPATPAAASTPPVKATPRASDAKKDWMREHGPGYTKVYEDLLKPNPPFKLYP